MAPTPDRDFRWIASRSEVDAALATQLVECWTEVSNAGGAVGFPFPPVKASEVVPAVEAMLDSLSPTANLLLVATEADRLVGWLLLERNASPLTAHWGRVLRVQSRLGSRRTGIGTTLMEEVARAARNEFGLEQLHIEVRSGQGLEAFYGRRGWLEVGRWPSALRLAPGDDRDEVLMLLSLNR